MGKTDQALFYIPILGLIFSIFSLGLSIKSVVDTEGWVPYRLINPDGSITESGRVYIHAPWPFKFFIGISAWSILVCTGLLTMPKMLVRIGAHSRAVGWLTLSLNIVTMVAWLVVLVFVILVFGARPTMGIYAALEMFTVLPWLCFVALVVLNVLTSYGTLESTRAGYPGLNRKHEKTMAPDEPELAEQRAKQ